MIIRRSFSKSDWPATAGRSLLPSFESKLMGVIMKILNVFAHENQQVVAAMALGTFDGVHIGHQKLITQAVELARRSKGKSLVFTSSNHPSAFLPAQKSPRLLLPPTEKIRLIRDLGVDYVGLIAYTPEVMAIQPEDFIAMIYRRFKPGCVIVGENYTYGCRAAGNITTLGLAAGQYGFQLEAHGLSRMNDASVSSTVIRRLIGEGTMAAAAQMLGRPFHITGKVYEADCRPGRIKELVLIVDIAGELVFPPKGLYHVTIMLDRERHDCVAKLETLGMTGGGMRRIAVRLLNFGNDSRQPACGQKIKIIFGSISAVTEAITAKAAQDMPRCR